jgi:hypothetical protein
MCCPGPVILGEHVSLLGWGVKCGSHCLGGFQDEGGEESEVGNDFSLSVEVRYRGSENYEIVSKRARLGRAEVVGVSAYQEIKGTMGSMIAFEHSEEDVEQYDPCEVGYWISSWGACFLDEEGDSCGSDRHPRGGEGLGPW